MKRVLVLVGLLTVAVLPASANAARECDGLDVCIPVRGPWVAIPAPAAGAPVATVVYQLNCPQRSIVGGVDALVSERAIDVTFLGLLGSPVNPGITTGRSLVFVATYAGGRPRPTAFQPFIGCIPTSGGGRGTTSAGAVRPGVPIVRRVRSFRIRPGGGSLALRCGTRERLVGSSHAVAFPRRAQPSETWLGAVQVQRRESGGRVLVSARRSVAVPASVRVDVQVHALCARTRP